MKNHFFPFTLLLSVILGGLSGYFGGGWIIYAKPIGELFLNLILTTVVPLLFFCISSAMTKIQSSVQVMLGKMIMLFISLGSIAALYMIGWVSLFPVQAPFDLASHFQLMAPAPTPFFMQLPELLTVNEFGALFSTKHMLALIIFSLLIGVAAKKTAPEGLFVQFLQNGEAVFIQVFELIMKVAPIGFFAYFATMVHELGPKLINGYVHVVSLYYWGSLTYFLLFYSAYVLFAGGRSLLRAYWKNLLIPGTTAIATSSSAATIPSNITSLKNMGVPSALAETTIPIGTLLHKQGTIMGGIIKIAFLASLFHFDFTSSNALLYAIGISLMMGSVMGAIPSGGLLGELFILHVYGLPPSALYLIVTISLLIEPPATLVNVAGNNVAGLLLNRMNIMKSKANAF